MACDCKRVVNIYAKHNDLVNWNVEHLSWEHNGYMPHLGVFGGDDLQLSICLDCGKIQNWVPITDEDIEECEEYAMNEGRRERELERRRQLMEDNGAPEVISGAIIEKNRISTLLKSGFGDQWKTDEAVLELLTAELLTATGNTLKGVKLLIEDLSSAPV